MKKFYQKALEILSNQIEQLYSYHDRLNEIRGSTANDIRKKADAEHELTNLERISANNKAAFTRLLEDTKEHVESALSEWKYAGDSRLTNLLTIISTADNFIGLSLDVLAAPFADDPASVNAVKSILKKKGASEETLAKIPSDYGDNPVGVLKGFESRVYTAFHPTLLGNKENLDTMLRAANRGTKNLTVELSATVVTAF